MIQRAFLCIRACARFACVVPIDGAADDVVVPLLLCGARAGAFEILRKCRLEVIQLVAFGMARPQKHHHAHKHSYYYSTVRSWVTKIRIGRTATAAAAAAAPWMLQRQMLLLIEFPAASKV